MLNAYEYDENIYMDDSTCPSRWASGFQEVCMTRNTYLGNSPRCLMDGQRSGMFSKPSLKVNGAAYCMRYPYVVT